MTAGQGVSLPRGRTEVDIIDRTTLALFVCASLGACASAPPFPPAVVPAVSALPRPVPVARRVKRLDTAALAARYALKMVGTPYRYGGAKPSTGFDCSGLVQYSFRRAGLIIPRTTSGQRRASVRVSHLRKGDLLFFDQEGRKDSHVGIYLGNGRFVHAPSSGERVRVDRLGSQYWSRHLSEVRRIGA